MDVLKVRVDNLTKKEILEKIEFFLSEEKFHQIATVNPEFILEAQKNERFREILNETDLNVADGIGIGYAFLRYGKLLKNRFAGVDLMHEVLKIANEKKLGVYLVINKNGLSKYEEVKDALKRHYPEVLFKGEDIDIESHQSSAVSHQALALGSEIVFCNFGSPYQEIFLDQLKNGNIQLAMGVGGSFDFVTEKIRRAPKFLRKVGLEWLWRLMIQPWRLRRIVNAVFVFPLKIIAEKNHE